MYVHKVEIKIKGITISEKAKMDKIREGTEKFQEEMVKQTDLLKQKGLVEVVGNHLQLGDVVIVEGKDTVLESIRLDPLFWDISPTDD